MKGDETKGLPKTVLAFIAGVSHIGGSSHICLPMPKEAAESQVRSWIESCQRNYRRQESIIKCSAFP